MNIGLEGITIIAHSLQEDPMARLGMVERDTLPDGERRFHDAVKSIRRRPISGPFIVTMNSSPDLAARFAHLGHYFHARGQADESIVSIRVRSFISLIGSRALDAPYEWAAWVNWALEAGVPQDTVDAIREGREPPNLTPEEKLVTQFCTQMISGNHRVSDATLPIEQPGPDSRVGGNRGNGEGHLRRTDLGRHIVSGQRVPLG